MAKFIVKAEKKFSSACLYLGKVQFRICPDDDQSFTIKGVIGMSAATPIQQLTEAGHVRP